MDWGYSNGNDSFLGNYVDCSMSILYILYFVFLYWAMILTRQSMNTFRSDHYWKEFDEYLRNTTVIDDDSFVRKTYHLLYWLNADRYYWTSGDLQNLAEAFFALGNVFSICRICFLLPIIEFVGPLQVSVAFSHTIILLWHSGHG